MRAKRRTFRAYLVEPFKQIRFGLHVVSVSLLFAGIFAFLFLEAYKEQYEQVFALFQVAEQTEVLQNDIFLRNRAKIIFAILAFVAIMLFVVVRRTHRMYGPMISMMRFVSELKRGNYAVRINVRQKDDFQSFVAELNALASELQKRHGVPSKKEPVQGMDDLDKRQQNFEDGVVVINDSNDQQNPPIAS
jgi:signal transduction histidine kinase